MADRNLPKDPQELREFLFKEEAAKEQASGEVIQAAWEALWSDEEPQSDDGQLTEAREALQHLLEAMAAHSNEALTTRIAPHIHAKETQATTHTVRLTSQNPVFWFAVMVPDHASPWIPSLFANSLQELCTVLGQEVCMEVEISSGEVVLFASEDDFFAGVVDEDEMYSLLEDNAPNILVLSHRLGGEVITLVFGGMVSSRPTLLNKQNPKTAPSDDQIKAQPTERWAAGTGSSQAPVPESTVEEDLTLLILKKISRDRRFVVFTAQETLRHARLYRGEECVHEVALWPKGERIAVDIHLLVTPNAAMSPRQWVFQKGRDIRWVFSRVNHPSR